MSITSLFNSLGAQSAYGYGSGSASSATSSLFDAVTQATGGSISTTATPSANGVSISTNAKLAAAAAADNAKDFTALAGEVRKALDDGNADLSEMSGRALATIILNRDGQFSRSELASAKAELAGRARDDFTALARGGASLSAISAYNQQLVSQYDAMSAEEREARGWTQQIHDSAQAFVSGSQNMLSLFDMLDEEF